MSVEIEPSELGFQRPFNVEVAQTLKLRNPNKTPVAFKVKTTAPKQYCVRPNSGRIEPGEQVEISVLLQAMKVEPPLDAKCRDKFLVQSVAVTADKEFANVAAIWQQIDPADKSAVSERKIRVTFIPADGAKPAATPQRASGVFREELDGTPGDNPPAYSSPAASEAPLKSEDDSIRLSTPASQRESQAGPSAVSNETGANSTYEELKAQLAEAKGLLASYTEGSGLRQRKAGSSDEVSDKSAPTAIAQTAGSGVPIQIAALLCFVSFLLAYFFF